MKIYTRTAFNKALSNLVNDSIIINEIITIEEYEDIKNTIGNSSCISGSLRDVGVEIKGISGGIIIPFTEFDPTKLSAYTQGVHSNTPMVGSDWDEIFEEELSPTASEKESNEDIIVEEGENLVDKVPRLYNGIVYLGKRYTNDQREVIESSKSSRRQYDDYLKYSIPFTLKERLQAINLIEGCKK